MVAESFVWEQESGARITVSPQQDQLPGVSDRVVLLLGTKDQVLHAMKLILNLLKDSRQYQRLSTTPVSLSVSSLHNMGHKFKLQHLARSQIVSCWL